ncbi:ketopantoate reductase PanE/ApbA C terminal-domain-containing protein [Talaromyces proteolyticus]|uniref:2-dehydropantoate 2-reductase n=1 Tax=Talaromyces proteolyticus TaxID=1131652 RepID=A0AAD4KVI9_9EURO|nr:ketopantoate reductase PanE/ApbA C terminal-domain-containing protein [Talaromyces proteolyticus]KAH8700756.1 ketopantoate reductase PanE/ApbA C terminal-domain-containing protein [Talaromyces proteolyticus]
MFDTRANILLCGCGAVGTMAAVALERSGCAAVTAVLRSNFSVVEQKGFTIDSVDHGRLTGWHPSYIARSVENAMKHGPFQFIVIALKALPDIYSIPELIAPAVTPFESTIVLIQNGIGIEQPFINAFPRSTILSGVSMIGAHQLSSGVIRHDRSDILHLGPIYNASISREKEDELAALFSSLYTSGGASCLLTENITWMRWKKLVWNASFNSVCAMTGLDSGAIIDAGGVETIIRPVMDKINSIAKASGHTLPDGIQQLMIDSMPREMHFRPSMLVDVERGNPMEIEVIVGNPLRIAQELGCETPILRMIYEHLKLVQWRIRRAKTGSRLQK